MKLVTNSFSWKRWNSSAYTSACMRKRMLVLRSELLHYRSPTQLFDGHQISYFYFLLISVMISWGHELGRSFVVDYMFCFVFFFVRSIIYRFTNLFLFFLLQVSCRSAAESECFLGVSLLRSIEMSYLCGCWLVFKSVEFRVNDVLTF